MHSFANATHLRLDINRPKHSLEVLSFKGSEARNQPYSFELQVLSPDGPLDAHEFLFSGGYLYPQATRLGIHGHVQSIVRTSTESTASNSLSTTPAHYHITFGPRLGLMAYRQNRRIFQGMCAERIIAQLLREHGIEDDRYLWQRQQPCVERDYCAQHFESDLQLLQRLCEEEGLNYHFLHSRNRHVVVFTDKPADEGPAHAGRLGVSTARVPASKPLTAPVRRAAMQRACVVGGLFTLATPDEKGRIQVRFEWGYQGDGARFNDCWIPLAPALDQRPSQWWGGLEVVVKFIDGNPERPVICDRLWDPDINPQTHRSMQELPRRVITTRIDTSLLSEDAQELFINDQLVVGLAQHNEMLFRVGDSEVTINSKALSLSGLKIMLSSIADAPMPPGAMES
jgi:uncharacterized protein involved in type VI secretion and phage assembly